VVEPWLYVGGTHTDSERGELRGSGGTFPAIDRLDFNPRPSSPSWHLVLSGATIESFYIHGDSQGQVLCGAFVTSARGGALRSSRARVAQEPVDLIN
jgi:hypothetical protein